MDPVVLAADLPTPHAENSLQPTALGLSTEAGSAASPENPQAPSKSIRASARAPRRAAAQTVPTLGIPTSQNATGWRTGAKGGRVHGPPGS